MLTKEEYLRIANEHCENYLNNKLKMEKNIRDNKLFNTISLESVEGRICFVKMFFSTSLLFPKLSVLYSTSALFQWDNDSRWQRDDGEVGKTFTLSFENFRWKLNSTWNFMMSHRKKWLFLEKNFYFTWTGKRLQHWAESERKKYWK